MIGSKGQRRGDREEEMVRLAQQGRIEIILDYKQPVELNNLFLLQVPQKQPLVVLPPSPPYPRVLLIEGPPGGGKSTFALHICHLWAQYASFLDRFEVVILVYLRDLAIQNATTLADILPAHYCTQTVASQIKASNGFNVLFIFDGWDEFPSLLQEKSLISTIIQEPQKLSLHQSTVLITTRPVSSGNLLHIADRRVEILGFAQHQIREYIEKALDGNSTHIQKLVQHLEEHPVIEGYCYIPLHVAILVHIFLTMKGTLPTTLHELFCNLVLCCIVRELDTHGKKQVISDMTSLDDLPDDLKCKLSDLCVLSYEGVMQNKIVFYHKDLHKFNLPTHLSSLGLLQAVEGLTLLSKSLSYNFLHLSVQELLAAYHISHMDSSEQLEVFERMFGGSRFQAVLHYYSGFTKLANPAIQDFISSQSQRKSTIGDQLPLLNCFFEAQEPSLCKLVVPQFKSMNLCDEWNPVDYLAIGYFATSLLSTSLLDVQLIINKEFNHHKLRLLFLELSKHCTNVPSSLVRRLKIRFNGTTVTIERAKLIAYLIQKSSHLSMLKMENCSIDSSAIVYIAEEVQNTNCSLTAIKIYTPAKLHEFEYTCGEHDGVALQNMCAKNKSLTHLTLSGMSGSSCYIFQGLQHNTTLSKLHLRYANLKCTESTSRALTTMLRLNKTLAFLDLSYNWTFGSLPYWVFEGLQHNTTLLHLSLKCTGLVVTEDTAQALTKMLQVNKTLTHLDLSQNEKFSDSGTYFLFQGLRHNATLVYLNLSHTRITDKGAEFIALALESNCCLQTLDITYNYISSRGLDFITKSQTSITSYPKKGILLKPQILP